MSKYYNNLKKKQLNSFKLNLKIKSIDDNLVKTSKYFKGIIKDNQQILLKRRFKPKATN